MRQMMGRAGQTATAIGLAAALLLLPLGITPANARSEDGAPLQMAQAGPGGARAPAGKPSGGSEVDRQIADLHKQLKITPQQEPQFNALAEILRNNEQELDAQMRQAPPNQHPSAVDQLKQFQQLTETQAAGLKRLVPALQALYDTLSDPQKKTADRVIGGGGEPGGPGARPPG